MTYEPPYNPGSAPPSSFRRKRRGKRAPTRTTARANTRPPAVAEVYRRRRHVLAILYVILSLTVVAGVFTSPALSIKRIGLRGADNLPANEAESTRRAIVLPAGTNWFRVPGGAMEAQLRALPWVRSAEVSRRFPNQVEAQVMLRIPRVLAQTPSGLYELDSDGVPIRRAAESEKGRLPLLVVQGSRAVQTGVPLNGEAARESLRLLESPSQDGMVRIAKIEVDQSDNICLNMQDGLPIQFGQVEDFQAKVTLVKQMYAQEPDIARRLAAVNLSCPSMPACTPRVATKPVARSGSPLAGRTP